MKIHVKTVLLTITLFTEFSESNFLMGWFGGGLLNNRRQKIYINYRQTKIAVTLDLDKKTPVGCNLVVPFARRQTIPNLKYREHHNYSTIALVRDNIRCVIFTKENGKVLGAKLPPTQTESARLPEGHPGRLNPDASKWYITVSGRDYEVKNNLEKRIVSGIELMPFNVIPSPIYSIKNKVETLSVHFGGVYFLVYEHITRGDRRIVGAQLNPNWKQRAISHNA